ncbi:MAG: EamA family transporter [Acidobacteria bacterium]|nr:EamA family transporter [Acidobacteriota bacterium]
MSPVVRRRAYLAFIAVCLIWGTTYLAIKLALETIPPFTMGGLRYLTGGVILALILRLRGVRLPAARDWPPFAVIGLLMLGFGNGGVTYAEQFVPSGLAAVLIATTPFWMTSVEALVGKGERLGPRKVVGLAVGFTGILVLVWPDLVASASGGSKYGAGILSLQLACIGWALGSSYAKRVSQTIDVLAAAAIQMLFGGAWMLLAAAVVGELPRLHFNPTTSAALLYLILAGSVAGYAAYAYALKHLPVSTVSMYAYINPVIAVTLGTALLGEPFHARMLVAAAIIAAGIAIVRMRGSGGTVRSASLATHEAPDAVSVRRAG